MIYRKRLRPLVRCRNIHHAPLRIAPLGLASAKLFQPCHIGTPCGTRVPPMPNFSSPRTTLGSGPAAQPSQPHAAHPRPRLTARPTRIGRASLLHYYRLQAPRGPSPGWVPTPRHLHGTTSCSGSPANTGPVARHGLSRPQLKGAGPRSPPFHAGATPQPHTSHGCKAGPTRPHSAPWRPHVLPFVPRASRSP